jgi:CDP-diacylglycerol---serine O-phosphatidyltransferase
MSKRASNESSGSNPPAADQGQQRQAMYLAQDTGHFSLIKAMHLADVLTLGNGLSGCKSAVSGQQRMQKILMHVIVMSVLSSIKYAADPSNTSNLWLAYAFIPFGLFFDLFDGKVARWRKKSSLMGQELDSLADLVG